MNKIAHVSDTDGRTGRTAVLYSVTAAQYGTELKLWCMSHCMSHCDSHTPDARCTLQQVIRWNFHTMSLRVPNNRCLVPLHPFFCTAAAWSLSRPGMLFLATQPVEWHEVFLLWHTVPQQ